MSKSREFLATILGVLLLGTLALFVATQTLGPARAPGEQGTPGPSTSLAPQDQGYPPPPTRALDANGYPLFIGPPANTSTPDPNYTDESRLPSPTNTAVPALPESFDPKTYGLPETLAGYAVLAVLTSENRACMPPGQNTVVLQSPYSSQGEMLTAHPWPTLEGSPEQTPHPTMAETATAWPTGVWHDSVPAALAALGLNPSEWFWTFAEPGEAREQAIERVREGNRYAQQHGCARTGGPIPTEVMVPTP
jgi:hypothetical protein